MSEMNQEEDSIFKRYFIDVMGKLPIKYGIRVLEFLKTGSQSKIY